MDTLNYDEHGSEDDIQTLKRQIHQTITRYLAQREHGFNEIISKLVQKGFPEELCREILEPMQAQDWQSDSRYAELLIKRRIERGYGYLYIAAECRSKGLDASLVNLVVEELDIDWFAQAQSAYLKKFGGLPASDGKSFSKRQNFLANRGYRMDEIRYACEHSDSFDQSSE